MFHKGSSSFGRNAFGSVHPFSAAAMAQERASKWAAIAGMLAFGTASSIMVREREKGKGTKKIQWA